MRSMAQVKLSLAVATGSSSQDALFSPHSFLIPYKGRSRVSVKKFLGYTTW